MYAAPLINSLSQALSDECSPRVDRPRTMPSCFKVIQNNEWRRDDLSFPGKFRKTLSIYMYIWPFWIFHKSFSSVVIPHLLTQCYYSIWLLKFWWKCFRHYLMSKQRFANGICLYGLGDILQLANSRRVVEKSYVSGNDWRYMMRQLPVYGTIDNTVIA